MIDTVVFDMGQVLIRWSGALLLEAYDLCEADKALLLRELFGEVEWIALDHGSITLQDAAERVCKRVPAHLHPVVTEIVNGWWKRCLVPVPGMAELVGELKEKGCGIYLLSNASVALPTYFRQIPGGEYFDGLMVSAEEKCVKPDPRIFRRLLDRFGLTAERCFFVDDSPANVEAALCAGFQGCVFHGSAAELRKKLIAAGIPVGSTAP